MTEYEKELQFIKDKLRYHDDFGAFVTEVIDLRYEDFHQEWIYSFENNRFNLLLAPRGHGKTLMVGSYIIWNIVKDPNVKILVVTINQDRANSIMRFIQKNLESNEKLIRIFGQQKSYVLWSRDALLVKDAKTRDNPTLKVVGVTGGMVGGHFDIIVLDDVTDKENSKTEHRRRSLEHQFSSEIMPMLEPDPYGKVIVVGTKWSQSDIYDFISKKPGYIFNKYQAVIKEPEESREFVDKLNWNEYTVDEAKEKIKEFVNSLPDDEKPTVLWDWKMPYEELARTRKANGNVAFMMQYQNEFISDIDSPVKWEWIESARDNYDYVNKPYEVYMGVDLASEGEESDYFTITTIIIKEGFVYVVDGFRGKLSLHGQIEEIRRMYLKWGAHKIGIEQAGPQKIVVQDVQARLAGYPIVPVKTSSVNDRPGRVMRLSVLFETGRIFVNPKLIEWIDELVSYPRGRHDDTIDSLSFAVQVSQTQDDNIPEIDWEAASEMIVSRNTVKSVDRSYDFFKIG